MSSSPGGYRAAGLDVDAPVVVLAGLAVGRARVVDPARGIAAHARIDDPAVAQLEDERVRRVVGIAVRALADDLPRRALAAVFDDPRALGDRRSWRTRRDREWRNCGRDRIFRARDGDRWRACGHGGLAVPKGTVDSTGAAGEPPLALGTRSMHRFAGSTVPSARLGPRCNARHYAAEGGRRACGNCVLGPVCPLGLG